MITELRIGCSHTVNLGNFESIRVEAAIVIEVDAEDQQDDAKWAEIKRGAQVELCKLLEETYRDQSRNRNPRATAAERARAGIWADPAYGATGQSDPSR